ncbi:hypothetical protein JF544_07035 [Halobacillus kuroshimensis]|uniref:Uncharacterized protein n=1 Tax=Halobacillus kuroshimensis TaxID=302481 RepID=A0ABS3DUU7_9BACI|nr:hypothetical protein [Halobacillus kuroshimensis]MBN8234998.1 hypothetical protein [Halobacillus kuroshimensis]
MIKENVERSSFAISKEQYKLRYYRFEEIHDQVLVIAPLESLEERFLYKLEAELMRAQLFFMEV